MCLLLATILSKIFELPFDWSCCILPTLLDLAIIDRISGDNFLKITLNRKNKN